MPKCEFAGIEIDNLTLAEAADRINQLSDSGQRGYVVTPNAYHITQLRRNPAFRRAYRDAVLVLPDSHWLVVASRLAGCRLRERCAGSDLFPLVLNVARKCRKRVFLLGGTRGSERVAAVRARDQFGLEVASYSPDFGFHQDREETRKIIEMINDWHTDFLFLHVGAPKSELWINKHINRLNISLAFCLGIALDYFAGTKRRAPRWLQRAGLEWAYRLVQEPGRLWKRYTIGNASFLMLAAAEIFKKRVELKRDSEDESTRQGSSGSPAR